MSMYFLCYIQFKVVDMKEARIDAILQSISKTLLVYLPKQAVDPNVFYEENLVRRDEICKSNFACLTTFINDLTAYLHLSFFNFFFQLMTYNRNLGMQK